MYTRVPPTNKKSNNAQSTRQERGNVIQIPQNYSGVAFSPDGTRTSPAPPEPYRHEAEAAKRPYTSPTPPPSFSPPGPLGYSDYPQHEQAEMNPSHEDDAPIERPDESLDAYGIDTEKSAPASAFPMQIKQNQGSLFASMLGDGIFKNNFPFGHGLGSEELLILGVMLAIYASGEADGELMLLLGILLFAG